MAANQFNVRLVFFSNCQMIQISGECIQYFISKTEFTLQCRSNYKNLKKVVFVFSLSLQGFFHLKKTLNETTQNHNYVTKTITSNPLLPAVWKLIKNDQFHSTTFLTPTRLQPWQSPRSDKLKKLRQGIWYLSYRIHLTCGDDPSLDIQESCKIWVELTRII